MASLPVVFLSKYLQEALGDVGVRVSAELVHHVPLLAQYERKVPAQHGS